MNCVLRKYTLVHIIRNLSLLVKPAGTQRKSGILKISGKIFNLFCVKKTRWLMNKAFLNKAFLNTFYWPYSGLFLLANQ